MDLNLFDWLSPISIGAIILLTISKGGGWFEALDTGARFENWKINIEFNLILWLFYILLIGGLLFLLIVVLSSNDEPVPSNYSRPAASVKSKHHSDSKTSKSSHRKVHKATPATPHKAKPIPAK